MSHPALLNTFAMGSERRIFFTYIFRPRCVVRKAMTVRLMRALTASPEFHFAGFAFGDDISKANMLLR